MANILKRAAVRTVKPLVSERLWAALKRRAGSKKLPLTPAEERRRALQAMSLTALALHFKTDKAGRHHYTQHYERHLSHLRDQKFTLLEIGIGGYRKAGRGGRSLRMWKHYFAKAAIVGLDIQDKSFVEEPRIRTYQGSQVDGDVLRRIIEEGGRPQVVVDDGSHRPEHVRETFRLLFPMLADDGIYVIEDTQTSYWPRWGGSTDLQSPDSTMALVKDLLDGLNHEEFVHEHEPSYTDLRVVGVHAYHNLVIIEKGHNNEGSNRRKRDAPSNAKSL